ncbi:MAG: GH3 auxin-responsive promoter family protein [Mogibacterium sp.]|nr:GH3 auxin-responsive promoter family protein [Mogibacterium sp.]
MNAERFRKEVIDKAEKAANVAVLCTGHLVGMAVRRQLIRKSHNGRFVSEKTLQKILKSSCDTEYGKKYGFADITSREEYQEKVPLSTYDDYSSYIKRMMNNGEQNLITGKRIKFYSATSGTVRERKMIPTAAAFDQLKGSILLADDLFKAMRMKGLKRLWGKGLLTTEIMPMSSEKDKNGLKVDVGVISAYAVGILKFLLPVLISQPGDTLLNPEIRDMRYIKSRYAMQDRELTYLGGVFTTALVDYIDYIKKNHEMLIHDIETGTIDTSVDISLRMRQKLEKELSPDPVRAAELRAVFDDPDGGPLLDRMWPDLAMMCFVGTGDFMPFTRKARAEAGSRVPFHFLQYSASENFFGQVMRLEDTSYLLFPEGGFYEFIPVEGEYDRPLFMDELEIGKLYEMVVTNKAGLYRYMLRDVIRVTGYEGQTPYIEFAYRANLVSDTSAIHMTTEHLDKLIEELEQETGTHIEEYCMYQDSSCNPPGNDLFFEANEGTADWDMEAVSEFVEMRLREINWDYRFCRESGKIRQIRLRPLEPGTCSRYRSIQLENGASANQLKVARVVRKEEMLQYLLQNLER